MVVVGIIGVCAVLALLAFLVPRFSRHPERGTQKSLGLGSRTAGKSPGKLGKWLSKPFRSSSRAASRSGPAGRKARRKFPI